MKNKEIENQIGKILREEKTLNGSILYTDCRKYFVAKRDPELSEAPAIEKISSYGVAPVIFVGDSYILEEYVEFYPQKLTLEDSGKLLYEIHKNTFQGRQLVHGDFGETNTTYVEGNPRCFDYEYTHFGNAYVDLGRVILRICESPEEMIHFFENYTGQIPTPKDLSEGLSSFCDRQNLMRIRKNLASQNIPLIRKNQIAKSKKDIVSIFNSFKQVRNNE